MISPDPKMPKPQQLAGKAVFLSASVPLKKRSKEYRRIQDAAISIEEAVVAVARAIFSSGGRIVFGAHPSISPLIASVVGEYVIPEFPQSDEKGLRPEHETQPKVIMYQSKVWEPFWAESSERLAEHPLVQISWTPIVDNETVSPAETDAPPASKSMTEMRKQMIKKTHPAAMIIIGGMEGTEEEARLFAEYCKGQPIFVLESTGGATSLIREKRATKNAFVIVADKQDRDKVIQFWKTQEDRDARFVGNEEIKEGSAPRPLREQHYYVPYSFIAQQIVEKIADQRDMGIK